MILFGKPATTPFRASEYCRSVSCGAVDLKTFGLITDTDLNTAFVSEAFKEMSRKVEDFSDKLDPVPDRYADESVYTKVKNANDEKVVAYIKKQAVKCVDIEQNQADFLCNPTNYGISISDSDCYTKLLRESASLWAQFNPMFLDVISSKVQVAIQKRDQYKDLELTEKDIITIESDVRKVGYLTAQFSLQTGKRTYIDGTSKKEKLDDLDKFTKEIAKASQLARVVNLTVEQIPPKAIFQELFEFQRKPKSKTTISKLNAKVTAFKNELIKKIKNAQTTAATYDLDADLK